MFSFGDPTVQGVLDGSDAAQLSRPQRVADRDVASVFCRCSGCRAANKHSRLGAGLGRAYRRTDGYGRRDAGRRQEHTLTFDALKACVKSGWRKATAGTPTSMCKRLDLPRSPTPAGAKEGYFTLLAGTGLDLLQCPNANYRTTASSWPG